MKIFTGVLLLTLTTLTVSCATTQKALSVAKEINNSSFTMAITRACSLTATLAAERTLKENQNIALQLFCSEMRTE